MTSAFTPPRRRKVRPGAGRPTGSVATAIPSLAICRGCHRELPITEFYADRSASSFGRKTICKDCFAHGKRIRDSFRKALGPGWKYCWACGTEGTLVIDHDHITGEFRGLLCRRCNLTLGHAHDNAELLQALAEYLGNHAGNPSHKE